VAQPIVRPIPGASPSIFVSLTSVFRGLWEGSSYKNNTILKVSLERGLTSLPAADQKLAFKHDWTHQSGPGGQRSGLTWVAAVSGNLLEAVVERQVVADGVLPARLVAAVEGEVVGDVLVDLAERHSLLG